ncbi:MAG: alpha/beta hydrolase [Lachnospiraceae bacterium]|nr:alpha/beta hydrolase [Lachnospiraceae bacterium]
MLNKKIFLYENRPNVTLTTYILDSSPKNPAWDSRPGILICPGGAYLYCSQREAEPIAMAFAAMGYHAFVLNYSVYADEGGDMNPNREFVVKPERVHPTPVREVGLAMKYLTEHAAEWHLDAERIAVCGFSAGAHNAAMYGVYWNSPMVTDYLGGAYRPAAMILGYALTDFTYISRLIPKCDDQAKALFRAINIAFAGTAEPPEELLKEISPALQVNAQTPPTFLWATADDELVPIRNTLAMAQGLADHQIPFEVHIFERGHHGLALATQATAKRKSQILPSAGKWVPMAGEWLKQWMPLQVPEG